MVTTWVEHSTTGANNCTGAANLIRHLLTIMSTQEAAVFALKNV